MFLSIRFVAECHSVKLTRFGIVSRVSLNFDLVLMIVTISLIPMVMKYIALAKATMRITANTGVIAGCNCHANSAYRIIMLLKVNQY